MSQFDLGNIESPISGTALINGKIEPWRDALHSSHSGPSRPSYAQAGMIWVNNTTNPRVVNFFTGSADVPIGTVNTTTNIFTPSGLVTAASGITYDPTGRTYTTGSNVQSAINQIDAKLVSLNSASGSVDFAGMAAEASIALGDYVLINDVSESSGANNKMLITDLLKVLNLLTEDTAPDTANDFVLTYDASASGPKKVRLNKIGGNGVPIAYAAVTGASILSLSGITGYDNYELNFNFTFPGSPADIRCEWSKNAGAAYTSSLLSRNYGRSAGSTSIGNAGGFSAGNAYCNLAYYPGGGGANQCCAGFARLYNWSNTNRYAALSVYSWHHTITDAFYYDGGANHVSDMNAFNALKLYPSANTITGEAYILGIKGQ
jgi:hypothetical protein